MKTEQEVQVMSEFCLHVCQMMLQMHEKCNAVEEKHVLAESLEVWSTIGQTFEWVADRTSVHSVLPARLTSMLGIVDQLLASLPRNEETRDSIAQMEALIANVRTILGTSTSGQADIPGADGLPTESVASGTVG